MDNFCLLIVILCMTHPLTLVKSLDWEQTQDPVEMALKAGACKPSVSSVVRPSISWLEVVRIFRDTEEEQTTFFIL